MPKPTHKPQAEIDDLLNACAANADAGVSAFPGATYEDGVAAALNWLLDEGEHPLIAGPQG